MNNANLPKNIGLYNPEYEHDSCGVGFACSIKGVKSNEIVKNGLKILNSLAHRGATGADPKTGDGAGILIQMPHEFMLKAALAAGIKLPSFGEYGTGLIFLPQQADDRKLCKEILEKTAAEYGQRVLGWRSVPVDNSDIGVTARQTQPVIEQVFIAKNPAVTLQRDFEVKLYIIRKVSEKKIRESGAAQKAFFYVPSLSSNTFIYKGLLTPQQVENFFVDLKDESIQSAISLVHSRYSTNTFPTWDLAQPFRYLAHNGEINTLRGNVNWMRAKEALLSSEIFGADIEKIKPIVVSGGSDSAMLDNVFELLTLAGRSTAHAMLMLIPAAWEHNRLLDDSMRSYYQYQNCIMEAWDGPAAIAFTDGINVGAVLDRNGLRPARYIVTKNDLVVMASEVGVLDIDPALIAHSGRLEPGKIFYINTKEGRIVSDDEVKRTISSSRPYSKWVRENIVDLDSLPKVEPREKISGDLMTVLKSFGYTREDLKIIIKPMLETAQEPVGSMGNDAPPAVLSRKNQLLYNYFKQLFAQVTNPPIDSIREEIVMSLECYMGPRRNILSEVPEHCHRLRLKHPVLTNGDLEKIKKIDIPGFKTKVISTLFNPADESDFTAALDRISVEAEAAVKDGYTYIVLSDRGTGKDRAALPALLAVGAVHQHLVRKTVRAQVALIVESGEPREVHHFALLFGFGAGAVNPYLAFEACRYSISEGVAELDEKKAEENYIKAVNKGILKILAKMGISTLQSYRGAQIFEALGLGDDIINRCFSGTVSRIGGADFSVIAKETILRHREAYPEIEGPVMLDSGGVYSWRRDGEFHLWNPDSISAIQDAVRNNDYGRYREFAALINDQSKDPVSLRSLLKFKTTKPVPVEEVEPVGEIFKRFASGAMSFGSISKNAHETIAIAMNRIGGKSNTGEGGEDPARFKPLSNGDLKRSAIKQVASGRFGVNANYLINADEIQIKIAQGAKPGEGGQLPGHKVSKIIARTRYTTPGVTLISPPPHHDIYSIEDLAQLIFDLKNINPTARISVKLVSEIGVGTVAAGVAKGHADMILISGGDGGTGASPVSSIKHAGLPWELGLAETHQTLVLNDLRSRVRLQADGQIRTGRDIAIAAMLGAEEFGFATTLLIIMGCVMLRHCHMDTCSVGIATQNDLLEKRFSGRPEYIVNYFNFIAQDLREIMAGLGIRKIDDLVGRSDLLEQNSSILPWKAGKIDFSKILFRPDSAGKSGVRKMFEQNHNIDSVLDKKLIELSAPALKNRKNVRIELPVNNTNRSLGAMLSGEVCRVYGEEGLFDDAIWCRFSGIAGQSFGAFLANGVTFELEGLANDYVGKGISGGKIIIYPSRKSCYKSDENIVIGNTTFYGAIDGEAYIMGVAGERFCIRNSGLNAVVEGVGDHGCEYMTGGKVVVIGKTGRNFAAGMSGGVAYVLDEDGQFRDRCNLGMVELEALNDGDRANLRTLIHNHFIYTGSAKAKTIIDNMQDYVGKFVKVFPIEYKNILASSKATEDSGEGD